jgi:uncharacterized membrane protein YwzB
MAVELIQFVFLILEFLGLNLGLEISYTDRFFLNFLNYSRQLLE